MNEQRLGKFRLIAELGRGGFATVYRAVDTTLEREVALKILDPLLMRDAVWAASFRQEARTFAMLKHPHIATIHEIGEAENQLYLALELAEGGSLAQMIETRGRLPWDEALALLKPVCEALDYAHSRGVVHRDLKPSNILLDPVRGPLLADFGLARIVGNNTMSMSLSGGMVGTPSYIAPEVWERNSSDTAGDIYALGCVIYEMLTGDILFVGDTPMQVMFAHGKGAHLPETWPDGVPAEVNAVLAKVLAQDPAARYRDARSVWHALAEAGAATQVDASRTQVITAMEQWKVSALRALAEGDFASAQMALGRWLALAPDDAEALALQRRLALSPPLAGGKRQARPTQVIPQPAVGAVRTPASPAGGAGRRLPSWLWIAAGIVAIAVVTGFIWSIATRGSNGPTLPAPTATHTKAPMPAYTAAPQAPVGIDGIEMVNVPAGAFQMGCDPAHNGGFDCLEGELPAHTVRLDAFWIDKIEVSVTQFRRFVQATGHETDAEKKGWSYAMVGGGWDEVEGADWAHPQGPSSQADDRHPVVHVSWNDAAAYCAWAGERLPTEAEWEYAARGPQAPAWPWGDAFDGTKLNYCDRSCPFDWKETEANDGYEQTAPVGSYPAGASWVGALDMAGNVWEWVADWYGENYYGDSPKDNPTGPVSGDLRAMRGGSWLNDGSVSRSAHRGRYSLSYAVYDIGFRCVVDGVVQD